MTAVTNMLTMALTGLMTRSPVLRCMTGQSEDGSAVCTSVQVCMTLKHKD